MTSLAMLLAECMLIVNSGEIPGPECKPALEYKMQELMIQAIGEMNVCVSAIPKGALAVEEKHCLKPRLKGKK